LGNDFSEYEKSRNQIDAIAELSYRNFMEMSSKTADDKFYCRRRLKNGFQINTLISGFHFIVGLHLVIVLILKP
jgi:hypothetical protein